MAVAHTRDRLDGMGSPRTEAEPRHDIVVGVARTAHSCSGLYRDSGVGNMETEAGLISKLRRVSPRLVVFIVLGVVLLVLALTGTFNASSQNTIDAEEAIEIARAEIDFVPVNEGARFVRQGVAMRPVWAVSFSIPEEGGGRAEFERLMTVEIDAESAEVIRISTDGGGE